MGRGGLLQTESRSFPSAGARRLLSHPCFAQGGEERTSSPALRPGLKTTCARCPTCPLQMARALGPIYAPWPLRQPGRICPQARAQRSRDKHTRSPCVPAGRFACEVSVGAALQGLLPDPFRPPSGALSSRSPWAVPRKVHRVLSTSCCPTRPC